MYTIIETVFLGSIIKEVFLEKNEEGQPVKYYLFQCYDKGYQQESTLVSDMLNHEATFNYLPDYQP